jgi:hypothetical protein
MEYGDPRSLQTSTDGKSNYGTNRGAYLRLLLSPEAGNEAHKSMGLARVGQVSGDVAARLVGIVDESCITEGQGYEV